MKLKHVYGFAILVISIMLAAGCSSAGGDSVTAPGSNQTPATVGETDPGRMLWGIWDVHFDPSEMTLTAVPVRGSLAHYDITNMVTPPACDDCVQMDVNSFDPVTRIIDVDVTLRNPYPISGKDVRGILYTNDAGHLLTNPDDWTPLWDIPGGLTYNPFRAFAKDVENRVFANDTEHTENYLVYIPKPPHYHAIRFAVDACWPGHCRDPYSIENFTQLGELYQFTGATVDIQVDVLDWQDDVQEVRIAAPAITGAELDLLSYQGGNTWGATLSKNTGAGPGDYDVMLMAYSIPMSIPLYDFATITITEITLPEVTAIDPDNALAGEELTDVSVYGDNFEGPGAHVTLKKSGEQDLLATNVVVHSVSTVTCDISIPPGAELGLWDVQVTNGTGAWDVGEALFEVLMPVPDSPVDITPDWLNFSPWRVAYSGNYLYVAAYFNGLHIFDVSDPLNPAWVSKVDIEAASDVCVVGNYAFVTDMYIGLQIVDVSNPGAPSIEMTVPLLDCLNSVDVDGGYAYVVDKNDCLHIVDIDPIGSASLVISVPSTGYAHRVGVDGGYAYVAAKLSGLDIIDVDPPGSAYVVTTVPAEDCIYDVAVAGGYAYAADYNTGLQIIDIDPPAEAAIVKTVETPWAWAVAFHDGYCYVAGTDSGLTIVDVDPVGEAAVAGLVEVPNLDSVAVGDSGYIFGGDSTIGLKIFDASNPTSPFMAAQRLTFGYSARIKANGDFLYVGNGSGGTLVVDVSQPDTPDIINAIDVGWSYMRGCNIDHNIAYIASGYPGLKIFDVADPLNVHEMKTVDTSGYAYDVSVGDGYACMADGNDGLQIIDIDPIDTAAVVGTVDTPNRADWVTYSNGYAYVGEPNGNLQIIDVYPPGSASIVQEVPIRASEVAIRGNYAYVAGGDDGLRIVDITTPETASLYKTFNPGGDMGGIRLLGDYAFIANHTDGLQIIDISDIDNPYLVGSLGDFPSSPEGIDIIGNHAFVACVNSGLRVIKLW